MKKLLAPAAVLGCLLCTLPLCAQHDFMGTAAPQTAPAPTIPVDQQPSREQLNRLFDAMRIRTQLDAMIKMLPQMIEQQVHTSMQQLLAQKAPDAQLTPDQQAKFDALMNKYIQLSLTTYAADDIISDITAVYQHHLTKDDVDAYIAFYNSPAGRHLLDAQPLIMGEYVPVVLKRQESAIESITSAMEKDLEEFTQSLTPAQKATPSR